MHFTLNYALSKNDHPFDICFVSSCFGARFNLPRASTNFCFWYWGSTHTSAARRSVTQLDIFDLKIYSKVTTSFFPNFFLLHQYQLGPTGLCTTSTMHQPCNENGESRLKNLANFFTQSIFCDV